MAGQVQHLPVQLSPEAIELREQIARLEKVVDRLEQLECADEELDNQGGTEHRAGDPRRDT